MRLWKARSAGRCDAVSRERVQPVPPHLAFGDGVVLEDACLIGTVPLGAEEQNAFLEVVNRAIADAARSHAVTLLSDNRAQTGRTSAIREDSCELFDPRRFDGALGTYDLPSYQGGTQKVSLKHLKNPFARLVMLYEPCITALNELYLASQPDNPNDNWIIIANRVVNVIDGLKDVGSAVDLIAQIYMGQKDPAQLDQHDTRKIELVNETFEFIKKDGQANTQAIAESEEHLRFLLLVAAIVRDRATELIGRLKRFKGSDKAYLRDVIIDLVSYYLEAVLLDDAEAAERMAFLDTFYADPSRVALYAVLRSVREGFENDLAPNLSKLNFAITQPAVTEVLGPGGKHEFLIEAPPNTGVNAALRSSFSYVQDEGS